MKITQTLKAIILALILVSGLHYASAAWTSAPATPPEDNVDAPINVGTNNQQKRGSLWVNTDTANEAIIGLRVFGRALFEDPIQIADGTQAAGKVLTSDANGIASWQEVTEAGVAPSGTFVVPNTPCTTSSNTACNTIMPTGVSSPTFTATVSGAVVGDAVMVVFPTNYYFGGATGNGTYPYYNGQGDLGNGGGNATTQTAANLCGPYTAVVSAADTVKVNFYNVFDNVTCTIAPGTYTVKIVRPGGSTVVSGSSDPLETVKMANGNFTGWPNYIACKYIWSASGATMNDPIIMLMTLGGFNYKSYPGISVEGPGPYAVYYSPAQVYGGNVAYGMYNKNGKWVMRGNNEGSADSTGQFGFSGYGTVYCPTQLTLDGRMVESY